MCAIAGALVWRTSKYSNQEADRIINHIFERSSERGRDGFGYEVRSDSGLTDRCKLLERHSANYVHIPLLKSYSNRTSIIANFRAEPTTEYILNKQKDDQQPYSLNGWSIVHNGTIANDKELRTNKVPTSIDSASIVETIGPAVTFGDFCEAIEKLKGSYAILGLNNSSSIFLAANYRPIWYAETEFGYFFASARDYFPSDCYPHMVDPYSAMVFDRGDKTTLVGSRSLPRGGSGRALVVCSGGLDSTVAATYAKKHYNHTELIHFQYGSRAEGPEVKAVQNVANELAVPCTLFPLPVYKPSDSPLLQKDSVIAGGEEGAEFAHEWVPARNLLLLSVATAYAEANNFDTIVLGNNLEEAGAYPDNEPEFIARFNDLLPFAVGANKRMEVIMPVGNLMKHEIVKLGVELGAPLDKTWSCYRAGELHCGVCGPCYMRRTAFNINKFEEVITYEKGYVSSTSVS